MGKNDNNKLWHSQHRYTEYGRAPAKQINTLPLIESLFKKADNFVRHVRTTSETSLEAYTMMGGDCRCSLSTNDLRQDMHVRV
jgi:hypothetical protein